jgi:hypothetical protein
MSAVEDAIPIQCCCADCTRSYDAAHRMLHDLLCGPTPLNAAYAHAGTVRALADMLACNTRPGREDQIEADTIDLFRRRYRASLEMSVQMDAAQAGRAN